MDFTEKFILNRCLKCLSRGLLHELAAALWRKGGKSTLAPNGFLEQEPKQGGRHGVSF